MGSIGREIVHHDSAEMDREHDRTYPAVVGYVYMMPLNMRQLKSNTSGYLDALVLVCVELTLHCTLTETHCLKSLL